MPALEYSQKFYTETSPMDQTITLLYTIFDLSHTYNDTILFFIGSVSDVLKGPFKYNFIR